MADETIGGGVTEERIRAVIQEELAKISGKVVTEEKVREISEGVMGSAGRAVAKKIGRKPSNYNRYVAHCHKTTREKYLAKAQEIVKASGGKIDLKEAKSGLQTKWMEECGKQWKITKEEAKAAGIEDTSGPEFLEFLEKKGLVDKRGTPEAEKLDNPPEKPEKAKKASGGKRGTVSKKDADDKAPKSAALKRSRKAASTGSQTLNEDGSAAGTAGDIEAMNDEEARLKAKKKAAAEASQSATLNETNEGGQG